MSAFSGLGASSHDGRPTFPLPGAPADMLLGWALPLLSDVASNSETAELALESLHEFVTVGEASATERYLPSVLQACQALLEDEGTPLRLLRPLLAILTAIARRFTRIFQPHFADLVDLLLGWVLMPDLSESDCFLITESLLQFQNLWAGNLAFSLNLLFKFLGDMEVLAQDTIPGTTNQMRRLFALASCFVAVLRAMTSGILELGLADDAAEPFQKLLHRLLACLEMVGLKYKTFKWLNEASTCLLLFATVLRGRFSKFYSLAADFLLRSFDLNHYQVAEQGENSTTFGILPHFPTLTSSQGQTLLKVNLELISLQGMNLPVSEVAKLLQSESFSRLRLHPSRSVTGVVTNTYLSLLKHDDDRVIQAATDNLVSELQSLKVLLCKMYGKGDILVSNEDGEGRIRLKLSELDVRLLIKFDVMALTCSVQHTSVQKDKHLGEKRAKDIRAFLLETVNPFESPLQFYADIQVAVVQSLHNLCCLGVGRGVSSAFSNKGSISFSGKDARIFALDCFLSCSKVLSKSLDITASLPLKMEALEWIGTLSNLVIRSQSFRVNEQLQDDKNHAWNDLEGRSAVDRDIISALIVTASDKERKVRSEVAKAIVLLFHAGFINPYDLVDIAEIALEHLGDPEAELQKAYSAVIALIVPATLWMLDHDSGHILAAGQHGRAWKKAFALRQFSQHLHPQQLLFVLNFIAQRWQVLPPSWLQRLICNFCCEKSLLKFRSGNAENIAVDIDPAYLDRVCSSSTVASAWWAVQEAARHCIAVRLRTHLGGPTQTFGALERMLLDVVHSLQAGLSSQRETGNITVLPSMQLLPMRLLLEFVEALKKNMYNAYEGSVVMPAAPPTSIPFFRANRKVCEEWFMRISEALMNASLGLQCHAATFHHAILRLSDLRNITVSAFRETPWPKIADGTYNLKLKSQQDVLRTLRVASLALCKAHASDIIVGLQTWATSMFVVLLSDDTLSVPKASSTFRPLSWMNGLILQAEGKYEKATAFFSQLLQSDDTLSALGADGAQFIIARTIESYVALSDWDALEAWLQDLQALRAKHAGKAYAGALTTAGHDMNAIHALACFDTGDIQGAWGHLDLTPQSNSDLTSDPYEALKRSEQMLLQALLQEGPGAQDSICKETEKAKDLLEGSLLVSGFDGVAQAAPFIMQLHCISTVEAEAMKQSKNSMQEAIQLPQLEAFEPFRQVEHLQLDKYHQDCCLWLKLLRVYRKVMPLSHSRFCLQWNLVRLARKQHNNKLSLRLLKEMYEMDGLGNRVVADGVLKDGLLGFEYEQILLQYGEGNRDEAIMTLWHLVKNFMMFPSASCDQKQAVIAKACLKLASWLQKEPSRAHILSLQTSSRKEDLRSRSSILVETNMNLGELSPGYDEVIAAALKSATILHPRMSKSWYSYAKWCYNQAKMSFSMNGSLQKPLLFTALLDTEFPENESAFTPEEREGIHMIILETLNDTQDLVIAHESKIASFEALKQRLIYLMQVAAGTRGYEDFDGESLSGILALQLQQELLEFVQGTHLSHAVAGCVKKLMELWWSLRKRRVSLYGHALKGFLKYLCLSTSTFERNVRAENVIMGNMNNSTDYRILSSSLYILNIISGYGMELDDIFRRSVSSVSPIPWQEITPQLFARLISHPEPVVRGQLEDLLMTLAHLSPSTVIYSTLVNLKTSNGGRSVELQRLLGCLMKLHPKMVADVQLMMAELGGITVLWEEQWLSMLQDLHSDVLRILASIKEEVARLANDTNLSSSEKLRITASSYANHMAPVLASLEQTLIATSRCPETVHERWFQEKYASQLKDAIYGLKSPPTSLSAISDVWHPFDAIVASLASEVKKSVIPLADVAPRLAAVSTSDVPIPGLHAQLGPTVRGDKNRDEDSKIPGIITVAAFNKQLHVLATKTKPKKLTMIGSDGRHYTYLLKGHEDLRLDARIMQLLHAVNRMLSNNPFTRGRGLAARHYSVTPISGRAGLIQWVDNLVSMYAVFKAWQQRNQVAQLSTGINSNAHEPVVPAAVPRPSDMFYGKLIPALKERGLRKVLSRKDWPQEVKRKVLLELIKETPRQLLYKELWCASDGFTSFSSKSLRFTKSVAVMSIVGYILGLGDRHLDNILMDFSTGDVMHIDYNVCFDKGLRLKIPEIVPFRLTHTIQAALGLMGVEGTFRCSCESVLEILRLNKKVILMLLDVFAWDPLIEWTKGEGHDGTFITGEEIKGSERPIPFQLGFPKEEHHAPVQVADDFGESQVAKSQESIEMNKEELTPVDHVKDNLDHMPVGHGEGICGSLDECIISQVEDESWISPRHTGGLTNGSSDKEMQDPIDSFWLRSPAESLGSPQQIWVESRSNSDHRMPPDAMLDFSALEIQEANDGASPQTVEVELHSQEVSSFLEDADVLNANSRIHSSQKQELSQAPAASTMLAFHTPNNPVITTTGSSSNFMETFEGDVRTCFDSARRKHDFFLNSRDLGGSNHEAMPSAALYDLGAVQLPRRKSAYAISVLKKVEMKLDGFDNESRRQLTIAEQVDYLLRQAMSIDNLCNMYEGWTPWI